MFSSVWKEGFALREYYGKKVVRILPPLLETLRRERRREWLPNMARRLPGLPYRAARKLYRVLRRRLAK